VLTRYDHSLRVERICDRQGKRRKTRITSPSVGPMGAERSRNRRRRRGRRRRPKGGRRHRRRRCGPLNRRLLRPARNFGHHSRGGPRLERPTVGSRRRRASTRRAPAWRHFQRVDHFETRGFQSVQVGDTARLSTRRRRSGALTKDHNVGRGDFPNALAPSDKARRHFALRANIARAEIT